MNAHDAARELTSIFVAMFMAFHRRTEKRTRVTPQGWALLEHLSMTGPLTVSEAARHMERAQSVMSEIISGLERKGLLARLRDMRDHRRTLVWLTDEGRDVLDEQRQVLSPERVEAAMRRLTAIQRQQLLSGLRALVHASVTTEGHLKHRRRHE